MLREKVTMLIIALCMAFGIFLVSFPSDASSHPGPRYRFTVEQPEVRDVSWWDRVLRAFRLSPVRVVQPQSGQTFRVTAVAYSSTPDQTYGDPCVTAMGTRVREGIVATNFLPLGTRIRIGDEEFVVEDRMNSRYDGKHIIDIWHPTREQAIQFGAQTLDIHVLSEQGEESVPVAVEQVSQEEQEDEEQQQTIVTRSVIEGAKIGILSGPKREVEVEIDPEPEERAGIVSVVQRVFSLFSRFGGVRTFYPDAEC